MLPTDTTFDNNSVYFDGNNKLHIGSLSTNNPIQAGITNNVVNFNDAFIFITTSFASLVATECDNDGNIDEDKEFAIATGILNNK